MVGGQEEPILAACVLQRLPVVRTPMSQEHRKLEAEERERALNTGEAKDYPKLVRRTQGAGVLACWDAWDKGLV